MNIVLNEIQPGHFEHDWCVGACFSVIAIKMGDFRAQPLVRYINGPIYRQDSFSIKYCMHLMYLSLSVVDMAVAMVVERAMAVDMASLPVVVPKSTLKDTDLVALDMEVDMEAVMVVNMAVDMVVDMAAALAVDILISTVLMLDMEVDMADLDMDLADLGMDIKSFKPFLC